MLTIGLVLTLLGAAMAVEMPGFVNNTHCVYLPTTKTFSCQLFDQTVECSAIANFSVFGPETTYHVFGIQKLRDTFTTGTPAVATYTYYLYPRSFDNTTYVSATYGTEDVVFYYGETFVHYGIRVLDLPCFERFVHLFGTVTDFHTVTVGTGTVDLIGEVLFNDAVVQKRWLYGYGFGYGYPYYGWGGYGGYGLGGFGYGGYGMGYGGWWGKK